MKNFTIKHALINGMPSIALYSDQDIEKEILAYDLATFSEHEAIEGITDFVESLEEIEGEKIRLINKLNERF